MRQDAKAGRMSKLNKIIKYFNQSSKCMPVASNLASIIWNGYYRMDDKMTRCEMYGNPFRTLLLN